MDINILKEAGCFGFRITNDGCKCEFDGGQRFHIFFDKDPNAEFGPYSIEAGGLSLDEVLSIIRRLKNYE